MKPAPNFWVLGGSRKNVCIDFRNYFFCMCFFYWFSDVGRGKEGDCEVPKDFVRKKYIRESNNSQEGVRINTAHSDQSGWWEIPKLHEFVAGVGSALMPAIESLGTGCLQPNDVQHQGTKCCDDQWENAIT